MIGIVNSELEFSLLGTIIPSTPTGSVTFLDSRRLPIFALNKTVFAGVITSAIITMYWTGRHLAHPLETR